ncbi:hypothetical protein Halha_1391 [Halobacteroides halobius DSM 5150]|uniref:Glutathionylspermidine synthase pre-ATP-grasp-like domain-containing protein n=1 Tax=Halobacteroides halobius (strain ATCC 35273 / DSM 5150 / MD-1) TaxID=748449 RepID=L0K8L0_HALHC|nr:glutathionylspermidine synthase family protein [Halobacteroides halobius]AGB41336.1 hypothetical protein Halha_1391 [Halobacteroides halobius DSM 5150]
MQEATIKYQEILKKGDDYYQDYQRLYKQLEDSYAYYNGRVIPFLYNPLFFNSTELDNFSHLVDKLNNILNKVVDEYLTSEEFRSYFDFSKKLEELILVDPGYECNLPMERCDIFYYGKDKIKFCELNADGSSGMVKTNTLEQYFLESKAVNDLKEDYDLMYCDLLDSWIDTLLGNYNQFSVTKKDPNVAIMDFNSYGMESEFKFFKEKLEEEGLEAKIVDPRDLTYDKGDLYIDDFKIDLIYRRAVTTDLMDHYEEIGDFIAAYKNQDVCVVGPIRSQVIHNKIIFAILHDQDKVSFLTKEEQEFIEKYIPYTVVVDPADEEQIEYIKQTKDQLVLKPKDSYGSEGVTIGQDVAPKEWQNKLSNLEAEKYLAQEFCLVPEIKLATFTNQELNFESYKHTLGLFCYNQDLQGIYTRAGKENVIASATGCVTQPNFIVSRK